MAKSFYDLDYIIEINEKRLAEYTALYQKVLERLTNIILVYSALEIVNDSLKGAYILELENAVGINSRAFRKKNSFFYNALLFALVAIIPYITCLGFHLSKKEDKVQKVEILKGKS